MVHDGVTYAVALWHNPSARTLPGHWLELRRMACAPDAPHCTASRFLAEMTKAQQTVRLYTGEEIDKLLKEVYSTPPAMIAKVKASMAGPDQK